MLVLQVMQERTVILILAGERKTNMKGSEGLDARDRVRVELIDTGGRRGFIDFARAGENRWIEIRPPRQGKR